MEPDSPYASLLQGKFHKDQWDLLPTMYNFVASGLAQLNIISIPNRY